jgi:hypothetical protein
MPQSIQRIETKGLDDRKSIVQPFLWDFGDPERASEARLPSNPRGARLVIVLV